MSIFVYLTWFHSMGISSANSGDIAVVLENDHGAAGFLPPHLWLLRQGKSAVINELNVPEHISRASVSPFSPPYSSSRYKSQHLQKHCDEGTVVCRQDDSKEGGWRWEPQGPSPLGALDLALLSDAPPGSGACDPMQSDQAVQVEGLLSCPILLAPSAWGP